MKQLRIQILTEREIVPLTLNTPIDDERPLIVEIFDANDNTSELIFRQTHSVKEVKQWFSENLRFLSDAPPLCLDDQDGNLLHDIETYYETASANELEKWLEPLFEYRTRHDLKFAFRGCDVPSVIIGNRKGRRCVFYRRDNDFICQQADVDVSDSTEKNRTDEQP